MKMETIRDMSVDQLKDQLMSLRKNQMEMRFQKASGQLNNSATLRAARRDIARVKTEMRAREQKAIQKKKDEGNA